MINEESLRAVAESRFGSRFLRPLYDTYGFARLPDTTTSLLKGAPVGQPLPMAALGGSLRQYGKVVVLLLDALGWSFLEPALTSGRYPFLERLVREGVVSKLTTQFPSTTTAHVTAMKYGQPVGRHGLYEWNIYDPAADGIIVPILFAPIGEPAEALRSVSLDPAQVYPEGPTYYETLAAAGVVSHVFESASFARSTYNLFTNRGAALLPFRTLAEGLVMLGEAVARASAPAYFYFYYDGIDTVSHKWGPDSAQVKAEIDLVLTTLERTLLPLLNGQKDVALLLTADHAHASVDPQRTTYLNLALPEIASWLKTNARGDLLKFAGSARDLFLHIKPEYLDLAEKRLTQLLTGKAEVHRTATLMREGFFGPDLSERFRARIADLVILAYDNESTWWYEADRFEVKNRGGHGGLERREAETFLGFLPMG